MPIGPMGVPMTPAYAAMPGVPPAAAHAITHAAAQAATAHAATAHAAAAHAAAAHAAATHSTPAHTAAAVATITPSTSTRHFLHCARHTLHVRRGGLC